MTPATKESAGQGRSSRAGPSRHLAPRDRGLTARRGVECGPGAGLGKVDEFAGWCARSVTMQQEKPDAFERLNEWRELERRISEGLPPIEKIANEVGPRPGELLRKADPGYEHQHKLEASRELRGAIPSQEETAEILGPRLRWTG